MNLDSGTGPEECLDLDEGEGYFMRFMTSKPHLIKDNPLLRELEDIGRKDKEYYTIINAIMTGASNKSLPPQSEGGRMEGRGVD